MEPNRAVLDKNGNSKAGRKTAKNVRDTIKNFGELKISWRKTSNSKKLEKELSEKFKLIYGENPEVPK